MLVVYECSIHKTTEASQCGRCSDFTAKPVAVEVADG